MQPQTNAPAILARMAVAAGMVRTDLIAFVHLAILVARAGEVRS